MKIESSRTTPTEKRTASTDKPETNFQSLFNSAEKLDSPPLSSRFAKVLEETRNHKQGDLDSASGRKTDRSEQSSETAKAKEDNETDNNVSNREKVEEKNQNQDGDQEPPDEQDKNSAFGLFALQTATKHMSEVAVPAARSILYVADLERIVSAIRTQNVKNAEQMVIALKHSVLEGLQIKLTIDESGTLRAEFLALNEQIKNQLNTRKHELTQVLRERGVKLSELNIQQGSEFDRPKNEADTTPPSNKISHPANGDEDVQALESDGQNSYRI